MNTLCERCSLPLFEHASDYMVREGHACRGDCQKAPQSRQVTRRQAEAVPSGRNANKGLEDLLGQHLDLHGIRYKREFGFAPPRRWRSDFHLTGTMFLIECEGIFLYEIGGYHQRPKQYTNDCEKYTKAALMGYKVLRYTGEQIRSGWAINQIVEAVKEI